MDGKARVMSGENPLGPLGTQQFPDDEKGRDLAGKDLRQPGVVDPRNPMEDSRLVDSALGHQKMEVGV